MAFESFYGGRQGASIVIVKRFDGLDIPKGTKYRVKNCAIYNYNGVDLYYYPWIEMDKYNQTDYEWKLLPLDGSTADVWLSDTSTVSQQVVDVVYAEGMRQCFELGGDSTDVVNYGEYVLIDTIAGLGSKSHPDNGKLFRRGMNFDYNETTNPLAGAEYIGQIVGPQGQAPELEIEHYVDIINEYQEKAHARIYDEANEDLVPGSWEESGSRQFEDTIKYVYATVRDEFGNIIGCTIGFKLTTLVMDFEARTIKPYENRAIDPDTGDYYNYDLIYEDADQYVNGKWQHPFYQKWHIKVPHGYHGIDSTNLEVVHTMTMPKGFKSNNYAGTPVYTDEDCTSPLIQDGNIVVLTEATTVLRGVDYDSSDEVLSAKITIDGNVYYVKKSDCYMDIFRYRETDYDNVEEGEVTYIEMGDFNTIRRVTISADGTLTVFYNAISTPQELEQVLRWIDTKDTDGITIAEDGTVRIYYNTLDENGEHEYQDYPTVLDWVTQVTLTQDGKFDVLYNNDTIQDGHYHADLNWVDLVKIHDDGTVEFYYNSNHDNPQFTFSKMIKYLTDVQIQTLTDGSVLEGSGDQRVHLTYNTTDAAGQQEEEVIGNPLNYVIEATISVPNQTYPNVPYSHLLVYYSDPALRRSLRSKWVAYPSTKVIDRTDSAGNPVYHVWTEWVDLGPVRGASGGIHILKDVADLDDLKDAAGEWIPPEKLEDSDGVINSGAAGWAVTYTPAGSTASNIMFYDYELKKWYTIGAINSSAIEPSLVVAKSEPTADQVPASGDVDSLKINGFWFATETAVFAM